MARPYDIMIAGHACLDIIPRFPDTGISQISEIMWPGKLVNVEQAVLSPGGPVSNTGTNMKTLGCNVSFCTRVGDDELGRLTIDMLRRRGNADGVRIVTGCASSYTVVVAPPGIDRIFLHNPGTNNTFGTDDLDSELVGRCRHFHFGYPPLMNRMFEDDGSELQRVFEIAKEAGATTSCDMSLPDPASAAGRADWRSILEKVLPFVDMFLPSIEEAHFMLDPDAFRAKKTAHGNADLIDYLAAEDFSRTADDVLAMGAKMVALKSGHRGFYFKTASKDAFGRMGAAQPGDQDNWSRRELWAPAFVVDSFGSATGSGDSSIAGLLSGFVRGLSIERCLKYATCCGLQNVRVLDAVSGIKSWDETTEMIEQDLPMIDAHVSSRGWKWSSAQALWSGPNDPLSAPNGA